MASAQVLPTSAASSSRKQGHLAAGKKKLEEFRKKKAEGRAKKAASTGQLLSADVDESEKVSQSFEQVRGGGRPSSNSDPSGSVVVQEDKPSYFPQSTDIGSSNEMHITSVLLNSGQALYGDSVQNVGERESKLYESSKFSELANGYYDHWKKNNETTPKMESRIEPSDSITTDRPNDFHPVLTNLNHDMENSYSSFDSFIKPQTDEDRDSSKVHMRVLETSDTNYVNSSEKSGRIPVQNKLGHPSTLAHKSEIHEGSTTGAGLYHPGNMDHGSAVGSDIGGRKIADSINRHLNVEHSHWHASEPSSRDSSSAFKSSQYQHPFPVTGYGTNSSRSRPSFLDSLGVSRVSSTSHFAFGEPEKVNQPVSFDNSKIWGTDAPAFSSFEQPLVELNTVQQTLRPSTSESVSEKELFINSFASLNDRELLKPDMGDHHAQKEQELLIPKKDEDFATLEQHIEDLTQEKFSLQRALETSRALAESLAAENSSLTDSYNQQGKVVNQLKFDMERLQEEIKAQLLAVESVKLEYRNAQLECNAADERAKILASEVIGLEEKALRLRSNELKLEKQVETLNSEITSYKRKVSILDRERQDFRSTIDALQEEKKLLQSKLWKASSNGEANDAKKISAKIDVSTSTGDLGEHLNLVDGETSVAETMVNSNVGLPDNRSSMFLTEDRGDVPDASTDIPHDQLRMIENINSLISELALEKEELMGALKIESANCSMLKDLNKDLSHKLEAQTQRLELLTAQRMASENVLPKPVDSRSMQDTTEYADEGDEVVERVLGWIMKLFPGGPSKRRTSKHL